MMIMISRGCFRVHLHYSVCVLQLLQEGALKPMKGNLSNETFFLNEIWIYYGFISKFLYSLTEDRHLTDELAQETMFRCWRKVETIRNYENIPAALIKITRNQFNQHLRKQKIMREELFEPERMNDMCFSEGSNIDAFIERDNRLHEIQQMINRITNKNHVRVVLLADYYGFTLKEIAKIMNKNYNTITSHHARGLAEMRGGSRFICPL